MIKTKWLEIGNGYVADNGLWIMCSSGLRRYFNIPKDAKFVRFLAFKKPTKSSINVKILKSYYSRPITNSGRLSKSRVYLNYLLSHSILESLVNQKVYVECEYK